jgi:ribulose-phosphate 3-epimerase
MVTIAPSVLSADYLRLGEHAREAEAAGAGSLQVDIMDGRFVPNLTFGPGIVAALRSAVKIRLDVHLMIVEPEKFLKDFADALRDASGQAGATCIIVHQEATDHIHMALQTLRGLGVEAGVCLNPGTPLSAIEEVLDLADMIQIMTVNPGWGGQPFIRSQLDKIRRLRWMLDERGLNTAIAVDGGIDTTTAPLVVDAGATVLVAGSSVFNNKASVADNITALKASFAQKA